MRKSKAGPDASRLARDHSTLAKGWLFKRGEGNKAYKRRFSVLQPAVLFRYYKSESDSAPLGVVSAHNYVAVRGDPDGSGKYPFSLEPIDGTGETRVYKLATESKEDLDSWLSGFAKSHVDHELELSKQRKELVEGFNRTAAQKEREAEATERRLASELASVQAELARLQSEHERSTKALETQATALKDSVELLSKLYKDVEGEEPAPMVVISTKGPAPSPHGPERLVDLARKLRDSSAVNYAMFRLEKRDSRTRGRSGTSGRSRAGSSTRRRSGSVRNGGPVSPRSKPHDRTRGDGGGGGGGGGGGDSDGGGGGESGVDDVGALPRSPQSPPSPSPKGAAGAGVGAGAGAGVGAGAGAGAGTGTATDTDTGGGSGSTTPRPGGGGADHVSSHEPTVAATGAIGGAGVPPPPPPPPPTSGAVDETGAAAGKGHGGGVADEAGGGEGAAESKGTDGSDRGRSSARSKGRRGSKHRRGSSGSEGSPRPRRHKHKHGHGYGHGEDGHGDGGTPRSRMGSRSPGRGKKKHHKKKHHKSRDRERHGHLRRRMSDLRDEEAASTPGSKDSPYFDARDAGRFRNPGRSVSVFSGTDIMSVDGTTVAEPKTPLQRLQEFYSIYDPSKVGDCEKILKAFEGREAVLWRLMEAKYKRSVTDSGPHASALQMSGLPGDRSSGAPATVIDAALMSQLLSADEDSEDSDPETAETLAQELLRSNPPTWIADETCKCCQICMRKFHLARRRHHCRRCGRCVCATCAPSELSRCIPEYGYFDPVRHCQDCFGL